jgi:hypothetical protein
MRNPHTLEDTKSQEISRKNVHKRENEKASQLIWGVGGDTYQLMFVLEKVKFTCH